MQRLTPVRIAAPLAVLVGVGAAWAPNSSANTGADDRPGVIDMEVTTRDGDTLSLSLDTAQFAAPHFDGSFVLTGEIDTLGASDTIPLTIETDALDVARTLALWTDVHVDGAVVSVTEDNVILLASFNDASGERLSAEITSPSGDATGRLDASGAVMPAAEVFATQNAEDTPESITANVWTYASSIAMGLVKRDGVTLTKCQRVAAETCGHECAPATDDDDDDTEPIERDCVKTLTWTSEGDCSFECYTKAECCSDDEK